MAMCLLWGQNIKMAVAPRPWQTPQHPTQSRQQKRPVPPSKSPRTVVPIKKKRTTASKSIASSARPSLFVQFFSMGQQFTQFLAIAGVTVAVGLYASTVHYQKVWSQEYDQLVQLQDDENRIVATNESIKEQFIEQTKAPETQLVTPSPKQDLYVPAPKAVKLRPEVAPHQQPLESNAPIGY